MLLLNGHKEKNDGKPEYRGLSHCHDQNGLLEVYDTAAVLLGIQDHNAFPIIQAPTVPVSS